MSFQVPLLGGPRPAAAKPACDGESLSDILPGKAEPSDLAWDAAARRLHLVSDNGQLLVLSVPAGRGSQASLELKVKVDGKPDLEGVALIPSRPDHVYLGVESPPAILELHLPSQTVVAEMPLRAAMDRDPPLDGEADNQGLESLLFIPPLKTTSGSARAGSGKQGQRLGYFIVGRQQDARLFVFEVTIDGDPASGPMSLELLGTAHLPGAPANDLSALTLWRSRIFMLFDKPKTLHVVSLDEMHAAINRMLDFGASRAPSDPGLQRRRRASGGTSPVIPSQLPPLQVLADSRTNIDGSGAFAFEIRGQEGIAFAEPAGGDPSAAADQTSVFVAVDAPHKSGRKDLLRFSVRDFLACFSDRGDAGIPRPV
ncbi:hypothetical protein HK105_206841 [Polyrhizophydium stewartii]|uniref:Phytase-like domain-containing protein n=1 Tax=Polyrhizophydium stewartii TaxID=2732419 RepID=A0ABR4N2I7_9FUNG